MLFSSIFMFFIVWQFYAATILYQSEVKHNLQYIKKESPRIETSLVNGNIEVLQNILWGIKGENTRKLVFTPRDPTLLHAPSLTIGNLSKRIFAINTKKINIINSGFNLGEIQIEIDVLKMMLTTLKNNYPLYIFVSLFFVIIMFIANLKTLKSLIFMKNALSEFKDLSQDNSTDNLQEALKTMSAKIPKLGVGLSFIEVMRHFLTIAKEKNDLDAEVQQTETQYKITRQFAHDVKSPVHALRVVSKDITQHLSPSNLKIFKMALNRITNTANSVLTQGNQLGEQDYFIKEKKDIKPFIQRVIKLKQVEFSELNKIELSYVDLSNRDGIYSNISTKPLFNILSNLINNAYDAIDESGKIEITTNVIDSELVIEVKDNGKGIPKDVIARIWDTGFSYDKREGCGLGLGHTKKTVEDYWHGKCYCESLLSTGTAVGFTLPLELI